MKEFLSQCLKETDGNDPSTLTRECLDFHSFLGWSMYADYLEVWLKYPNLLVLYADDIEENPIEVAKAVETYLGLPPNSSPYKTTGLGALEDTNLGSIAFDVQTQLTKAKDDRQATADLVEYFKPNVKKLHDMAEKGIIPALPYKWMRRYDIPVKHEIKAFPKTPQLDDAEFKGLLKSLRQTDNKLDDLVADTTRAKSISGSKVGIDQVLEGIGGGNKRSASGESGGGAFSTPFSMVHTYRLAITLGRPIRPLRRRRSSDRDGKPVRNEGNVTGAKGNVTDAKDTDDFNKLKSKSKLLQKQAERKERLTKPHWEAGTVRGRFYSDLYVPMDREIRDSLKETSSSPSPCRTSFNSPTSLNTTRRGWTSLALRRKTRLACTANCGGMIARTRSSGPRFRDVAVRIVASSAAIAKTRWACEENRRQFYN